VVGTTVGFAAEGTITLSNGDDLSKLLEGEGWEGDQIVGRFTVEGTDCTELTSDQIAANWTARVDWGDGRHSTGRISCDDGDKKFLVKRSHTYADSGTPASTPFAITVTVTDRHNSELTAGPTQTDSVLVDDASILGVGSAMVEPESPITEGQTVTVTALFVDQNRLAETSGLTGTAHWPDGSTTAGTVAEVEVGTPGLPSEWCCHAYRVTVTGTPDAGVKNQEPFVTLSDDGGSFANRFFSLTVNDAALTAGAAKSFVAAAAQSSSQVVASFSDGAGAQAAVADFTATIKWGDNTTSAGTVTKTAAGKFDVSGSHTYATAGTKTLTITVVDEEGATVTMSATATVPALPTTGQPQNPVRPSTPVLPLVALVLGLAIAGSAGLVLRRMRN
jgi:hypothetical protein